MRLRISAFAFAMMCCFATPALSQESETLREELERLQKEPEAASEELASLLAQARTAIETSEGPDVERCSRASRLAQAALLLAERRIALLRESVRSQEARARLTRARRRLLAAEEAAASSEARP